jgi:hypothetical protein
MAALSGPVGLIKAINLLLAAISTANVVAGFSAPDRQARG